MRFVSKLPCTRQSFFVAPVIALALFMTAAQLDADVISFHFNDLDRFDNNSAIESYMQDVIDAANVAGSVSVSGARVRTIYTGDNHVVGPVINGNVQPVTLGTSDGGVHHPNSIDAYLTNHNSDRIVIEFDFPVFEVAFDYQIFPDGTLPDGTKTTPANANWPDFSFVADGTLVFRTIGIMPGEQGTFPHSVFSGTGGPELAPQFIGQSGTLVFPNGVQKLEFVDWPRMIGIDNLTVNTGITPQQDPIPEPNTILILSAGLIGAAWIRRRRRPAA